MHDNFFVPMAEETKLLFHMAEKYAPDVIANLHGAAESGYEVLSPGCYHSAMKENAIAFDERMCEIFAARGWAYKKNGCKNEVPEFNLTAALYMCCGAFSVTWESYQGVKKYDGETIPETIYDEILEAHLVFFEEIFRCATEKYK